MLDCPQRVLINYNQTVIVVLVRTENKHLPLVELGQRRHSQADLVFVNVRREGPHNRVVAIVASFLPLLTEIRDWSLVGRSMCVRAWLRD